MGNHWTFEEPNCWKSYRCNQALWFFERYHDQRTLLHMLTSKYYNYWCFSPVFDSTAKSCTWFITARPNSFWNPEQIPGCGDGAVFDFTTCSNYIWKYTWKKRIPKFVKFSNPIRVWFGLCFSDVFREQQYEFDLALYSAQNSTTITIGWLGKHFSRAANSRTNWLVGKIIDPFDPSASSYIAWTNIFCIRSGANSTKLIWYHNEDHTQWFRQFLKGFIFWLDYSANF